MKTFILFGLLSAIFVAAFGSVSLIPADTKPGHPGYCNSDMTGPLEKGATKDIKGECTQAECLASKDIRLTSCGTTEGCKAKIDSSKPYPACCPSC